MNEEGHDLDPIGPSELGVRGMPTSAFGPRGSTTAATLLDLGALAAASGMTRAQVNDFLNKAQNMALKTVLAAAPELLVTTRQLTQAKLNEVATRINQLPRVTAQPTGWRAMLGAQDPNAPAYVSLEHVRLILTEAMAASLADL